MATKSRSAFTLSGGISDIAPSVLGFWQTASRAASNDIVAFDVGAAQTDALIWQVNLPNDTQRATAQLADGEARLSAAKSTLATSTRRIASLVKSQSGATSFDVLSTRVPLPQPEVDLLSALNELQRPTQATAFGLSDQLMRGWQEATQSFQSVVDQLVKFVANYAWVETQVEGQWLGRTVVAWDGDTNTLWKNHLSEPQVALHERALALALASRNMLIHTFAVASKGAVILATLPVLLSTPAGAMAALPAAWKFVNQVLAELDKA
jgi:hypothetical protein